MYLLKYQNGRFLQLIHTLFKLLDDEVPLNPSVDTSDKESVAFSLREALFNVIRVYINLVHDYHGQSMSLLNSFLFNILFNYSILL